MYNNTVCSDSHRDFRPFYYLNTCLLLFAIFSITYYDVIITSSSHLLKRGFGLLKRGFYQLLRDFDRFLSHCIGIDLHTHGNS